MPDGNKWKLNVPTHLGTSYSSAPFLYGNTIGYVQPNFNKIGVTGYGKPSEPSIFEKVGNWWDSLWSKDEKEESSTIQGTIDELGQLFLAAAALVAVVFVFKNFGKKGK
jgi:hypothetical protein